MRAKPSWRWIRAGLVVLVVTSLVAVAFAIGRANSDEEPRSKPTAMAFAPVRRGTLTATVVTRGDVVAQNPIPIVASSATDDGAVITLLPAVDATVGDGAVLYEANDRPVFGLDGDIPLYRDLMVGDRGDDVQRMQDALLRLGLFQGTPNGQYNATTATAVREFYRQRGYEPPDSGGSATPIRRSEFTVVSALPATVTSVGRSLGAPVIGDAPIATLSSGKTAVEVPFLEPGFARFVGRDVQLFLEPGAAPESGMVTGTTARADGTSVLVVSSEELTADHVGRNIRVVIVDREAAEPALLVPLSALITRGDGESQVDRRDADGTLHRVDVVVIDEAGGEVAVTPRVSDALQEGDEVRVVPA